LRTLARQVAVYGSGRLALQLVSFLTLPILTRILSPEEYGVIEAVTTMLAVIAVFASLSLESAAQRSYFDYAPEQVDERRVVLSSAFWPMVLWAAALAAATAALAAPISTLLFGTDDYATVILLAVIALPVAVATTFFLEVMRLRLQAVRYVLVSWFGALLSVALILYLVAVADRGLQGFYLAGVISAVPTFLVAAAVARGAIRATINWPALRTMLLYALPLIPVAASNWVLQFVDRLFVLHYSDLHDLGLYALGLRLSNVLLLVVGAFAFAWAPFILDLFSREPQREPFVRARALTYVALVTAFGAVCLSIYAREFFLTVTDPAFADAYKLVGVLCAGIFALGLNAVTMTGISIARRTRYFAQYAVYAAALNVALNFALIPTFGIMGAAIATSLTFIVQAWLYYRRAQLLSPAPFDSRRIGAIAATATVLIVIGTFVNLEPLWLSALVKLPLVLALPLLAWSRGWVKGLSLDLLRAPAVRPGPG
jgi:O-antigen/teichoic acid export membrane protein